jgi:hypothetical protein
VGETEGRAPQPRLGIPDSQLERVHEALVACLEGGLWAGGPDQLSAERALAWVRTEGRRRRLPWGRSVRPH